MELFPTCKWKSYHSIRLEKTLFVFSCQLWYLCEKGRRMVGCCCAKQHISCTSFWIRQKREKEKGRKRKFFYVLLAYKLSWAPIPHIRTTLEWNISRTQIHSTDIFEQTHTSLQTSMPKYEQNRNRVIVHKLRAS